MQLFLILDKEKRFCPFCNKNESKGWNTLFQKNGSIVLELEECDKCFQELFSEWL